jgi:hypothetical protein
MPPWAWKGWQVCAIAFFGDALYGITEDEDLVVFDLAKDDDGEPIVPRLKRVIKHQLADGEEDRLSWIDEYYNISFDKFLDDDDDGVMMVGDDDDVMWLWDGTVVFGRDVVTTRCLVESSCELFMVRHQEQWPRFHLPRLHSHLTWRGRTMGSGHRHCASSRRGALSQPISQQGHSCLWRHHRGFCIFCRY